MGAGELLDRAVTIFVRQFVPIVLVIAAATVPLIAFQAAISPHSARAFSDIAQVLSTAANSAASKEAAKQLQLDSQGNGMLAILVVASTGARLLMWSAIVAVIAAAYAGTPISFAQAYRIGVSRWLPQLIVALSFIVMAGFAMIPLLIAYFMLIIVIAALASLQQLIATVVVAIIGGLLVFGAFAITASWAFMLYELAAVAVVTEAANPIAAIGIAFRRGFARGMKRRTIIGGLVIFLVSEGGALPLVAVAAIVTAMTRIDVLYFAIIGTGTVLLDGLVAAFVVVFATDVRIRREGLDLFAEAPPALA